MAKHKYHSGKFCPITKRKCRLECVALESLDFCSIIDGHKETYSALEKLFEKMADIILEIK